MTTAVRRRRTFGPLFYTTLALAALLTLSVQILTGGLWLKARAYEEYVPSPDEEAEAYAATLSDAAAEAKSRVIAASRLAGTLHRAVSGDEASGPRGQALMALRKALRAEDREVAVAAAQSLASLWKHGRSATGDLEAALDAEDQVLQLAAAKALIQVGGDATRGLGTLSKLMADPALLPRRSDVVSTMVGAGPAGEDAAVAAFGRMLSDPDEDVRLAAAEALPALGSAAGRLRPKLEALLDSPEPAVRFTAAHAILHENGPGPNPGPNADPRLVAAIESAVLDTSRALHLREQALGTLHELSLAAVRRCGLELSRQLDAEDYDARLAAASLLHSIDPEILAGPATFRAGSPAGP
jgi:hypothetical protein